jgi:hypothetical protein
MSIIKEKEINMVFEGYGCKTPELCLLSYPTKDKDTSCSQCVLRYQEKTINEDNPASDFEVKLF